MPHTLSVQSSPEALLALHHAAADWHVRRQQDDWSQADEIAFQAWVASNPLHHHQALSQAAQLWQLAPLLKAQEAAASAPLASATKSQINQRGQRKATSNQNDRTPSWNFLTSRRMAMASVAAAGTAVALASWHQTRNAVQYQQQVATKQGERTNITLPDGSQISLNTQTSIDIRFYPQRREVVLHGGEAFFQVAPDTARPFTVASGRSEVKVVGTAFNMQANDQQLSVTVSEGKVQVRPQGQDLSSPILLLGPGSGVRIDQTTLAHHSIPVVADQVASWRSGQLRFNRTPLADVAQELARYLGKPVILASTDLATLPISGFLLTRAPENFIQSLPDVAAVHTTKLADGSWRISPP